MKKLISIITLISLLAVLLTGCGKIKVDKSVEALKAKGMRDAATYTTDEDLEFATELYNYEIEYWDGDFTVRIDGYTSLVADLDFTKKVEFITFSSRKEAKAYTELYLGNRDEYSDSKIAQKGRVVVITNLDLVIKTLDVEFE